MFGIVRHGDAPLQRRPADGQVGHAGFQLADDLIAPDFRSQEPRVLLDVRNHPRHILSEPEEVRRLRDEKDRLRQELEEAEKVYYGAMFWVAYPAGLAAVIVGLLFPVQVIGAGLLFGGLFSLTAGCYSYWDRMDGWLRFGSLLIALLVIFILGSLRYRTPAIPRS